VRLVLDTNVLVASLTGKAAPRHLVEAARAEIFQLCTSQVLLAEFLHVLSRPMFARRLRDAGLTARGLVDDLGRIALVVSPPVVPRVVVKDPDDDHVLACAIVASADLIVSGDSDLLELRAYQGIPILKPADALARIAAGR
jgi:putative PIN family toxin of toxin-antitoxin system